LNSFLAYYGKVEVVKFLINAPSIDISIGIKAASLHGHIEIVKLLMNDPRIEQDTLNQSFEEACKEGRLDILALLSTRVNPADTRGLHNAVIFGQAEVVERLLADYGLGVTSTLIQTATRKRHKDVVSILLKYRM
jgi:hypothetical protein